MLEMFTVLALCHTVRVEKKLGQSDSRYNNDNQYHEFDYQSSSPDEKALVEACQR